MLCADTLGRYYLDNDSWFFLEITYWTKPQKHRDLQKLLWVFMQNLWSHLVQPFFVTKFTPFLHNFYKLKFKNSWCLEIAPHRIKKNTWENNLNPADKSSQRRCSLKKNVLKKITGKHLCPSSLLFYKVAGLSLAVIKQSRLPYVWHFNGH